MENYIPKEEAKRLHCYWCRYFTGSRSNKENKKTIKTIKESQLIGRWIGFKRNFINIDVQSKWLERRKREWKSMRCQKNIKNNIQPWI